MGLLDLLNHLWNFALPAVWLATLLVALERLLVRRLLVRMGAGRQWLLLCGTGLVVLTAGVLLLGRDGAMATYMALALVVGGMQAVLVRRPA